MSEIVPSILTNNVSNFSNKLFILNGQIDWVQIDVMDGKFVRDKSVTLNSIKEIHPQVNFEVHLMTLNPEKYIADSKKIGIKRIIFHLESTTTPEKVIKQIKKAKMEPGIAINPETSIDQIVPFLDKISTVLIMSVHPGFGGQKFIRSSLKKIKKLRKLAPQIVIGVDGGVNHRNVKKIAKAGANYMIIGSGIFKYKNPLKMLNKIKNKVIKY